MDRLAGRDLALDGIQKPDELLMPVALHATADDLCVYRKPKRERSGDEVRPGRRVK